MGYAEVRASLGTGFTTDTALDGLSSAVIVGTGRRVRVTGYIFVTTDAVPTSLQMKIKQDGVEIQIYEVPLSAVGFRVTYNGVVVLTPTPGPHTYSLSAGRTAGTGDITIQGFSINPMFIEVEDIGAA